jgi:flagellin-like protein
MRKRFSERRAVSPVIATVLMILITMVGMTLLFAFVTSYSDSYKAGVGSSVLESLTTEDVWLSPNSGPGVHYYTDMVNITVYNTGKIDSTINSIYVNGTALAVKGLVNLNIPVPVGAHVNITAQWYQPWVTGYTYTFKIETQRGSNFETNYAAP